MKRAFLLIRSLVIAAICCEMSPALAEPPDVHFCGSAPTNFDGSPCAIGKFDMHRCALPSQFDVIDEDVNASKQAKQLEENRIFRIYKASIFNSIDMQRQLEVIVKLLEYASGNVVSIDDVIWSYISRVYHLEHTKVEFTGAASSVPSPIQFKKNDRTLYEGVYEADSSLVKLACQVIGSFHGYERQAKRLKEYREKTLRYPEMISAVEQQRLLIAEDQSRFRLIQLAGLEVVEQVERETSGSVQSQSFPGSNY